MMKKEVSEEYGAHFYRGTRFGLLLERPTGRTISPSCP